MRGGLLAAPDKAGQKEHLLGISGAFSRRASIYAVNLTEMNHRTLKNAMNWVVPAETASGVAATAPQTISRLLFCLTAAN